jgi:hypothetical protein
MSAQSHHLIIEILLLQQGRVVHSEPLAARALFVGRNPDNDLVLTEQTVSGRHAVFHLGGRGEGLLVRDLASTNGTFVNDQRVSKPRALENGDRVRLGSSTHLEVRIRQQPGAALPPLPPTLLVDLDTGVAHPVRSDRIYLGSEPHCSVRIPDMPTACITLHDGGEIQLSTEDDELSLEQGIPFAVAGKELVFRSPASALAATAREQVTRTTYGYQLQVRLQGGTGPEAWVHCPQQGIRYCVTAENRVSLLWVLANQLLEDQQRGARPEASGWCLDEEVMRGIWGRSWDQMGSNNFQVLLSRTRRELTKAGLDGWFIEKRRGYTRLRLQTVELIGA